MEEKRYMSLRSIALITALSVATLLSACGGGAPTTPNTTANATNTNTAVETTKKAPEATTNNAPTLAPVLKAYCDAWVKNDEAALRKVYSTATIKEFEEEMKEEKAKSLIKFLESTDKVSGEPCELTNETITGDKAVARMKTNKAPNGMAIEFVKEGGEWKMTNRSPEVTGVKPSAPAANAPK